MEHVETRRGVSSSGVHDDPQAQVGDDAQAGVQRVGADDGLVVAAFKNQFMVHGVSGDARKVVRCLLITLACFNFRSPGEWGGVAYNLVTAASRGNG